MRTIAVTVIAVSIALFGVFAGCHFTPAQSQAQRPNGEGGCGGGKDPFGDEPPRTELSISGDLNQGGNHQVSLDSVQQIVINVSSTWGGGKVTVRPGLISASFTVENTRKSESETGNKNPLTFQITSLNANVKSFSYPRKVITGENAFHIVREKSFVRVFGSSGSVKLNGEAEATLTNRLFSGNNPATVKIIFEGQYDFSSKKAILTKMEAHASSPKS